MGAPNQRHFVHLRRCRPAGRRGRSRHPVLEMEGSNKTPSSTQGVGTNRERAFQATAPTRNYYKSSKRNGTKGRTMAFRMGTNAQKSFGRQRFCRGRLRNNATAISSIFPQRGKKKT